MSQSLPIKRPKNPCTGVCRIDKSTGLCRGCWRTRPEIKGWKKLSEADRDGVLAAIALRRSRKRGGTVDEPPLASPAQAADARPGGLPRWRHRKSGRIVVELHRALAKGGRVRRGTEMVVYRDEHDRVWVRPAAEFDDGRFAPL